jgi:hypothetical protein
MPSVLEGLEYRQDIALQYDPKKAPVGDRPVILRNLGFLEGDWRDFVLSRPQTPSFGPLSRNIAEMPLHEFLAEEAPKNENFLLKPLDKSEHIMLKAFS